MPIVPFCSPNYSSEVFAFGHRIGAPEVPAEDIVQALTNESYLGRKDVEECAEDSAPSNSEQFENECNTQLAAAGSSVLQSILASYLRYHLRRAPEELVEAVVAYLTSDAVLADIAKNIGVDVLVRTGEHPPSQSSLATAFRALAGALSEERARCFALDLIVPQLLDVDFADIFPLNDPLAVLTDLVKAQGAQEIEPRLLRSAGEVSAQPVYIVGIYKDKTDIIGQSAGETVEVAVDMAAREGLLRLWELTADKVFFFGDRAASVSLEEFKKANYRLSEKCGKDTDLSLESSLDEDPINVVEVAMRHKNEIENVVGKSYTKRLRHKFSRGSLGKRSFRYLIKPKVYTVA